MSVLSPLFLLGALTVAIPLALHLLKRQPDVRLKFSAVHLLRAAPVEHADRRRLRELILLACRIAALLLLVFAFARPFFASSAAAGAQSTLVIAVDTSLSMSAPGQFARAQEAANRAVTEAGAGTRVAVVAFDDTARVLARPSTDHGAATAAIGGLQPSASGTRYRAVVDTAAQLFDDAGGSVVIVTDLQQSGWADGENATLPASASLKVIDVGVPPPDLAITALEARGQRVLGTIRNTGDAPRDVRVRFRVGEAADPASGRDAGDAVTVSVPAEQSADFTAPIDGGRWVSATIEDANGIEADNVRYTLIDEATRPSVLVLTSTGDLEREAFYVRHALLAEGSEGRAFDVAGAAAGDLSGWDQARLDRYAAIIILSTRALEHHGRELIADYVRSGGGVLAAASSDVDGDVLSDALAGPRLTLVTPDNQAEATRTLAPSDLRHPVLTAFGGSSSLALVRFPRITIVRATGCDTLARFTTGEPALFDCESGRGRALVIAADLENRGNDFPVHATFVPFLHEAMRYLSRASHRGEYLVTDVPAGVPAVPGIVAVPAAGQQALAAVNVDPAEVEPARVSEAEFTAAVGQSKAVPVSAGRSDNEDREERQHLWRYLLMAMALFLVAESMVATRTA
jgi:hypothetical protein